MVPSPRKTAAAAVVLLLVILAAGWDPPLSQSNLPCLLPPPAGTDKKSPLEQAAIVSRPRAVLAASPATKLSSRQPRRHPRLRPLEAGNNFVRRCSAPPRACWEGGDGPPMPFEWDELLCSSASSSRNVGAGRWESIIPTAPLPARTCLCPSATQFCLATSSSALRLLTCLPAAGTQFACLRQDARDCQPHDDSPARSMSQ
ncbi:hypothetical protein HU200_018085 [Digitaria exilis]|uniref:Uncharacterized protein n=1 Tax=Digitaria exilis TaxID=1010633 RepID=A0A835KF05_9POAL|nr:hypothetical protein HU200_018085 [Digitaria exilis]